MRSKALHGHLEFAMVRRIGERATVMTTPAPRRGAVLIVEDEAMIRMMVADMLADLGYPIAAETGDIDDAITLARTATFDIAILDVNVNGKLISPVADIIAARPRPFVFVTGYGAQGLPPNHRDRPVLQKPFQMETLAAILASALDGHDSDDLLRG
jgi:CheY-like chemotaxis protein